MPEEIHSAFDAVDERVGARPLTVHLGSGGELTTLSPIACSHQLTKVHSLGSLRDFLVAYRDEALGPFEFRQISASYQLAQKTYIRELLELDEKLSEDPALKEFQLASRHVGKRQLNRLRAMKDLKLVQRYREAVNEGKAYGWHTLVYGVVLATYSLPLRQGLLHYGRQTLGGFIGSATRTLDLPSDATLELQVELNATLPKLIEQTIQLNGSAIKLLS